MRYYIIAGEASGDLHGANLMRGLYAGDPEAEVRFWGGDAMANVGGTLVQHYREGAVMGGVEVLAKAGRLLANLSFCKTDLLAWRPDVVVLIDYPGFNLRMAEFAKKHGFKVFYYIAPKVWARGERRIKKIRRYVDSLYIIFPFEVEYFRSRGVEARYFGNPLLDSLQGLSNSTGPVPPKAGVIALLPGSRKAELAFLMPRFAELEALMRQDRRFDGYMLAVAGAPSMTPRDYAPYIPEDSTMTVLFGRTGELLAEAPAAVISSGTASLEAALIGTPQVVCYGFRRITYLLAKMLVKVRYISLANLILDRLIFKELIQKDASPEKMLKELERLLFDSGCRRRMASDYAELRQALGGEGASERIANDMINSLKHK